MQLRVLTSVLLLVAGASPASADVCTLIVANGGTLGVSGDGARLGSQESGGISAVISVMSVGPSTLTISAPSLTQYPVGYDPIGASLEVAYRGAGVLAVVDQPYTTAPTSVPVPNLFQEVLLTLDNRIRTASGFTAGIYQTRTVITCS
jgi:hypothetical protein